MKRFAWILSAVLAQACASLPTSSGTDGAPLPESIIRSPERFILVTVRNEPMPLPPRAGSTARGYDSAGGYSVSPQARSIMRKLASQYGLREVTAWPITATRVYCVVFEVPDESAREEVLARLSKEPQVQLAQAMNTFAAASSPGTYNDPYLDLQHGFHQMAIPAAHRWSRGSGVRVAIIDTGMDLQHPDLAGRVVAERNFIDRDRKRFERDRHGTEVAGIIAALADNSVGIAGVAPDVRILAFKACWQLQAADDAAVCNSFTLAQGLAAAMDTRAHVINLSVVGPADPLLAELVVEADRRGIVVVGAASPAGKETAFPGHTAGVIAVDVARPGSETSPLVRAPGDDIFTLAPAGGYGFASGTSLAAAHVSGVVALLLSRDRGLRAEHVRRLLTAATERLATPLGVLESINACAALAELLGQGSCPQQANVALATGSAAVHSVEND